MPRKRRPLAPKKKAVEKKDIAPCGLSRKQFASLVHDHGSFVVGSSTHDERTFAVSDVVYVRFQDLDDDEVVPAEDYWIAQITDIKASNPGDVWVRVRWYWAPDEVAEVIKSFDPTVCGKYEKLTSGNYDIIPVHSIVDRVKIEYFEETSPYQVSIGDEEWFTRYHFSYDAKRISPKVTHSACSRCKVPYTPGNMCILHFCPRPSCRTFHHQSCLVKNGYVAPCREHRLLETWPDIDRTATVQDVACSAPRRTKRLKRSHHDGNDGDDCTSRQSVRVDGEGGKDLLSDMPSKLVAIADQPMIRGYPGGGVVGNITTVTAARNLIYEALSDGDGIVPDDWETRMGISTAYPLARTDGFPHCFCPSCRSPI